MSNSTVLNQQNLFNLNTWIGRFALLALLCAAALFGSGKTLAESDPSPKGMMHNQQDDEGMEQHGRMVEGLNLNDEQRKAFKNAMKQMHESMDDMRSLHEQLRDVVQSDDYDESKVRKIIHKNDKERDENIIKGTKAMHDFYVSLSPEQKTKFNEVRKEMKSHMKERMKGHKGKQCDGEESEENI